MRERWQRLRRPARLGAFRRTTPVSDVWGFDRGKPIDRYYIERFLAVHSDDIRGRVLEVKDDGYTREYGRQVTSSEVVDIDRTNPNATIYADLADAGAIASDSFHCFILTQTLQLIYDVEAVVRHAHRILRPGGVLLATVPTVSRLRGTNARSPDYWRFTPASSHRLFGDVFGPSQTEVGAHGNVLVGMAFLTGMAAEELSRRRLDHCDARFPILVTIRAVKSAGGENAPTL